MNYPHQRGPGRTQTGGGIGGAVVGRSHGAGAGAHGPGKHHPDQLTRSRAGLWRGRCGVGGAGVGRWRGARGTAAHGPGTHRPDQCTRSRAGLSSADSLNLVSGAFKTQPIQREKNSRTPALRRPARRPRLGHCNPSGPCCTGWAARITSQVQRCGRLCGSSETCLSQESGACSQRRGPCRVSSIHVPAARGPRLAHQSLGTAQT